MQASIITRSPTSVYIRDKLLIPGIRLATDCFHISNYCVSCFYRHKGTVITPSKVFVIADFAGSMCYIRGTSMCSITWSLTQENRWRHLTLTQIFKKYKYYVLGFLYIFSSYTYVINTFCFFLLILKNLSFFEFIICH